MASRSIRLLRLGFVCLPLLWGAGLGAVRAQDIPQPEYPVKAAFLLNFAKFVEWPAPAFAQPDAPLVIGVIGDGPWGNAGEVFTGKTVQGRPVVVEQVELGPALKNCHVLFVAASEEKRARRILESLASASVLTVSDMDGFLERGGLIQFVTEHNKVRFEINRAAAQRAGLKVSAQLLKLAKAVRDPVPPKKP